MRLTAVGQQERKSMPNFFPFLGTNCERFALPAWAFVVALIAGGARLACAQDMTSPTDYQFFVTPYLWLASVHATTLTPLAHEPQVNSNVSTIDLLSDLDGAPFMGSGEVRYGQFGFLVDAIHLPVSTNITTHDIFYQGGKAELTANTGTGIALYRMLEDPVQFADAGIGFRAWGFSASLGLNPGLLPGASVTRSDGWTDPLIGARYHRDLGNGFSLTAYGDFGGFGVGAHTDWQVLGTVDYTPSPWVNLHLGYRSLNFDYSADNSNLGFNVHLRGPILAATFRF
jgi:hypothetical protein